MQTETYKAGKIIFREGDPGDCMYDVYMGRVGIFADYGTENEKMLRDYYADQYFGEMGLLDKAPRSATAVALENNTTLGIVTEERFGEFFKKNPARVLMVMQELSQSLRKRTNEYLNVCREIHDLTEKEETA